MSQKNKTMSSYATAVHPPPPHSPPSSDSDSDTPPSTSTTPRIDFSSTLFKSYLDLTGHDTPNQQDLIKIQSFLTSSRSNALSCLICLERIKNTDPTWSCSSRCFSVFHLLCIQSWAQQSSSLAAARAVTRAVTVSDLSVLWHCPKCRSEYTKGKIPRCYYCFCGKVENPDHDPWVLPHSCGEICGRNLRDNCGHFCVLLCHPGPCPSCPKLVKSRCFCGGLEDVKRCGFKEFSCGNMCKKVLDCKVHRCGEICHEGECPPCRKKAVFRCQCGKVEKERECFERGFRCENDCKKLLKCGRHVCERGCHEGECGGCPLQGKRTCPCGKTVYEGMACDVVAPVCGATCDKMLSCGFHRCPERCHRGVCIENCNIVVTKSCRCGSLRKQVPCYQDLTCERKCQNIRDCGRHACKRRCCDGDCPPCSEICDRKLRCRNHKCPAPCHRGVCAPCPVMVMLSCLCGETHFEVPCGTEKEQVPPKCRKACRVKPLCRHATTSKAHKCHYGACPPCRLICEEEYSCGHNCKLRCHGPRPPPLPEFTLKPKKKKFNHPSEPTPGTSCPPCPELVWRSCLGNHIGADRMMVCSNKPEFSCDNLCGNLLRCGNHYCTKVCHALKHLSAEHDGLAKGESCEKCNLPCEKERKPACLHSCPLRCHPEECPPCKTLVKRSCHCGSMVHVFECTYYNSLSEEEQLAVRSCGGPCHRKLPFCTHLCPEICHPGQCQSPDKCAKKVIVRCGCQNLKKEWICKDVQAAHRDTGRDPKDVSKNQNGYGLLPCNSDCKSKQKVADTELQLRKSKPKEKEADTENHIPKRRRRRQRAQEDENISVLHKIIASMWRLLLLVAIAIAVLGLSYVGYKGLMWLSDWMNEVEIQRQQKRYARI